MPLPLRRGLTRVFVLLFVALATSFAHADPIEPEKAFALSAHALDDDTLEVRFDIRRDYYMYDAQLDFTVDEADVILGPPQIPPGTQYEDEFFGETEIHRDRLVILIPVDSAPADGIFELTVHSQGCWDGGVCYPPMTQDVVVDLNNPGPASNGSLLDRVLGKGNDAAARPDAARAPPALGDESGRVASLLRDAGPGLVLASFFGFGLLLSFTPCVLPMVPILSGIILGQGAQLTRSRAFVLSLAYVLGMAVTYALAGIAAGLSGTMLTAALQNVWVLGAFALVFVALALSMFGLYELQLPASLQSRLAATAQRQRGGQIGGVAVMGVLSALILGPCVAAPLAGALLYIAQSGDAVLGGLALFTMALGMGVPLIAVGVGTRTLLPRLGLWMNGVKKAFGMLLLAVAVWMLAPLMPAPVSLIGYGLLLLFSAVYLRALDPLPHEASGALRFWKGVGVALLIAGAAMLIGVLGGARDPLQPLAVFNASQSATAEAPRFEYIDSIDELEARLRTADQPVMLDFYADWCVACKEMERFTFSNADVAARMDQMLLLKADVTANRDEHRALLQRFDLFGPPGIVFFDAEGAEIETIRVTGFMRSGPFTEVLDAVLE